jgi:1,4-alpha-glucan branching enzyme
MLQSLLNKMPGDPWQQRANLRSLLAWMWAHPGKELLFMGAELAQPSEWNHDASLEWDLLQHDEHRGVHDLVRSLNQIQRERPALYERDATEDGFQWIDASDVDGNVLSFLRRSAGGADVVVCVANLSPVPRQGYRVGLPAGGPWIEVLNTDAVAFGGSGVGNGGSAHAGNDPWHGQPFSAELTLPPLGVIWLRPAD